MRKSTLAKQLRKRQYQCDELPKHVVDSLSNEEIIDCYITCSCCGKKLVTELELAYTIDIAENSEDFLDICEEMDNVKRN